MVVATLDMVAQSPAHEEFMILKIAAPRKWYPKRKLLV
jgi:hypothetical protein